MIGRSLLAGVAKMLAAVAGGDLAYSVTMIVLPRLAG